MSHFGSFSPFHAHPHLVVFRHDDGYTIYFSHSIPPSRRPLSSAGDAGSHSIIHPILFSPNPMVLSISFVFEAVGCGGDSRWISDHVLADGLPMATITTTSCTLNGADSLQQLHLNTHGHGHSIWRSRTMKPTQCSMHWVPRWADRHTN